MQQNPAAQDEQALEEAYDALGRAGINVRHGTPEECADRRVLSFLTFSDPTGNKFDLVVRPFKATRRYFPTRDAESSKWEMAAGSCYSDVAAGPAATPCPGGGIGRRASLRC